MKRFFAPFLLLIVLIGCNQQQIPIIEPAIVPQPQSLKVDRTSSFTLPARFGISSTKAASQVPATFLKDFLETNGWKALLNGENHDILFSTKEGLPDEGYELNVGPSGIEIRSSSESGFFYGVQSLIQMLPTSPQTIRIPYMEIKDAPRFQWRGLHLDVCRHFFPVDFIKKYIDLMALYKFNTFHWHLTEDQGWRIEIKQYPLLTEIGSQRKETILDKNFDPYIGDGEPYEGYYTQEEIREVVAYAQTRQVTIVPEIEMPGHSLAALAAYPELGCGPGPYEVGTKWGVFEDIYCPSEETFTFLENVLTEVMDLFPGKYIHIGGDEAPKTVWENSPLAQSVIKRERLKDEHELQSYFIKRIEKFLHANGRQLIGWDEILEGGLAPGAAVMSWRGEAGGIEAAEAEHPVVMTPNTYLYFDYYQGDEATEPMAIGGFIPLEKVYNYDPLPTYLEQEFHSYILGAQANVWTEYLKTSKQVEYMVYPRALALAEVVWSDPSKKDWDQFQQKLSTQYKLLDARDVNYHLASPIGLKNTLTMEDRIDIHLSQQYENGRIHFSLDGSQPSLSSQIYEDPILLDLTNKPVTVKAIVITESGKSSAVVTAVYEKATLTPPVQPLKTESGLQVLQFDSTYTSVSQIGGSPNKSYTSETIKLPNSQPDQFGLIFQGFIEVPTDGIYTFYLVSDDGSTLSIANKIVVDNDGLHGPQERSGDVALQAGLHPIEIRYFEAGGGESLQVLVQRTELDKQDIPADWLHH